MSDNAINPNWPAPANVRSVISTRGGGFSTGPYQGNNLALHVADDGDVVVRNRQHFGRVEGLPEAVQWLEQTADGCVTSQPKLACAVMTADCLPVLMCDRQGSQVAAVHAGWRGLAAGVLTNAVKRFTCSPEDILVYLGPAIGQSYFEVGIDVLEVFYEQAQTAAQLDQITKAFQPSIHKPMRFHADIYQLAKAELNTSGVTGIYGGDYCTYLEQQRFYSYRRDGVTGRMAAFIWLS